MEAFDTRDQEQSELRADKDKYSGPSATATLLERIDYIHKLEAANRQLRVYIRALITIPESYLMALLSQYDAFLGNLLKAILLEKPELLTLSEKQITFAQLVEFGSTDAARDYFLEKEVEGVLRKSHPDQFAWMEVKFNTPLRQGLAIWPTFVEITERRNLLVHTGGIVSSQYVKVCKDNNVHLDNLKVGSHLSVDPQYFQQAYNVVYELGFKLAQVLWRKFIPAQMAIADRNLIDIGYRDALCAENYDLTKAIFDFATEVLKEHSGEEPRLIMTVNRALAYKWSGDDAKAKEIIAREDWTATMMKFRLAEAVIQDRYDAAYALMRKIGDKSTEVTILDYRDWPLFKAIKREPKFLEVFEQIFGEPYDKVEVPVVELPPDLAEHPG